MSPKIIKGRILKRIKDLRVSSKFSEDIENLIFTINSKNSDLLNELRKNENNREYVLKLANSIIFDINESITSIDEFVDKLGFDELRNVLTMVIMSNIFAKGSAYEMSKGEMRRQAIAAALISRHLEKFVPKEIRYDLFIACLLVDIGKIILGDEVDNAYFRITSLVKNKGIDFLTAEQETFGLTHADIGAELLMNWKIKEEIIEAVKYHHEPNRVPNSNLIHFVSLSLTISMLAGYSTGIDGMEYRGFPELFKKYNLKHKDIEIILTDSINEIKEIIPYKFDIQRRE